MNTGEVEPYIQEAQLHLAAGRIHLTEQLCQQILDINPESAEAWYLLALAAYRRGDDREIEQLLHNALELQPQDERFIAMLGGYYRNQSQYEQALACFSRAASEHPESINALRAQGETLLAMDQLDAAESLYRQVLQADPNDRAARTELAGILLRGGNAAEAITLLQSVTRQHPDDALSLARLAEANVAEGLYDEAHRLALEAVARSPQLADPHKTLGDLAQSAGHLEEAVKHYRSYVEHKYSLVKLAQKFRTDKWGSHFYAQHYHDHFFPLRDQMLNLLEIGIGGWSHPLRGGASLRMWKEFFPKGNIFGIDIQEKSSLEEDRIRVFQGGQDDADFLRRVVTRIGKLDIIIDDGSHINRHVIDTFITLFPLLAADGIYVVEDTQTSYWPKFGGNSTDLNHPDSSLSFFKSLTDGLNYEELLLPGRSPSYFERHIIAMHFYHNMVFIYKGDNREGSNFVADGALLLE